MTSVFLLLLKQLVPIKRRAPVRIEILSSAENTSLLHNDLNDILVDAFSCCEYLGYVDKDGSTRVKIECIVSEDEKQYTWDQLRLKHATDCYISADPAELSTEQVMIPWLTRYLDQVSKEVKKVTIVKQLKWTMTEALDKSDPAKAGLLKIMKTNPMQ